MPDLSLQDSMTRYECAKHDRINFDSLWDDIAQLCELKRDFLRENVTQGERRHIEVFDSTAPHMCELLPAAIHYLLTNPGDKWMDLQLDEFQQTDKTGQEWLHDATSRMLMFFALPHSGFATASHEVYQDMVAFGNAGLQANAVTPGRFKFIARALSGMYWLEDGNADVTDVFRCTPERVRDLRVMFGSRVPDHLISEDPNSAVRAGEERVELVHHVWLRRDRDPNSRSNLNMPWGSRYFLANQNRGRREQELSLGGFRESPYITPRWAKAADETYGRGPVDKALADIKSVNAMSRDQLVAGALRTRPPVSVWDASLKNRKLELFPGGVNRMKQGVDPRFAPQAMDTGADPDSAEASILRKQRAIERMMFADLLELPLIDKSHSAMTAEEARIRRAAALAKASPIISRLTAECLVPEVGKTFRWMLRRGMFQPIPASLGGRNVRVVFTSPAAQSQRQREAQLVMEGMEAAAVIATADPTVYYNLDPDAAFRLVWRNIGANPKALRSQRMVDELRQAQNAQRELAEGAGIAKDLAKAGADASKLLEAGAA